MFQLRDAVGKVTDAAYDPNARSITYVAEIYDSAVADKIRNGLIRHVSVGADYQAMDLVDAKVPHGLYNAELSLVAVPGMPETTVQVLEKFSNGVEKLEEKDLDILAEKVAAKIGGKDTAVTEKLKVELAESKKLQSEAENKAKLAEELRVKAAGDLNKCKHGD